MKRFLCIFVSVAIIATLSTSAFAQGAGPKGGGQGKQGGGLGGPSGMRGGMKGIERMKKMEEAIFKKLVITAKQKTDITALDKTTADKMRKLMESMRDSGGKLGDADRKAMGQKMKAIMDGRESGLKKILGDSKFKKYGELRKAEMDKMRKERQKDRKEGGNPGQPRPPKP